MVTKHQRYSGFTLIEVLVAMAIVALGLTAVFMQVNQMLASSIYLQQKTLATWVAVDRITEIRLQAEYPKPGQTKDEIEMGGIRWGYRVTVAETPADNLRRIDVAVFPADNPDSILATASGFRGVAIQRDTGPVMPGVGTGQGGIPNGLTQ
jgi:general secretion pathway protein I